MTDTIKIQLHNNGFAITPLIYNFKEVKAIIKVIENCDSRSKSLIKIKELFAIRQLMKTLPQLKPLVFNSKLLQLISEVSGEDYFLTKAIYFDKPKESNWFVAYHQDISISVKEKYDVDLYSNWTFKREQYGVIPPVEILNSIITIRIHLDDTNEYNGALKVIPKSHLNGIVRLDSNKWKIEPEQLCVVKKGAIMFMKPLLFHSSNRTTTNEQRRVIHLEFSNKLLEKPLKWLEKMDYK